MGDATKPAPPVADPPLDGSDADDRGELFTSVRRRMLRGSAWVMGGKVATIVLGVAINGLLARLLTPEEVGAFLTTYTLVVIGSTVAQFGLDRAVVRFVSGALGAGEPGVARAAIRKVLTYGAVGAALVGLVLALGLGDWLADTVFRSALVGSVMPLAIGWLMATALQYLFVETFRGLQRFDLSTIFDSLLMDTLTATAFGVAILAWEAFDLTDAVALAAGATLLTTMIAGVRLIPRVRALDGPGDISRHEIFSFAWPLLVTNIAILLLGRGVDLWILGAFRDQSEVALYGAASRLVVFVATPFLIIQGVTPPIVAELHARGRIREMERALRGAATIAGMPSFLVLLFFVAFGEPVLGIVFKPFYEQAATVLVILCVGRLVAVWTGSCAVVLMMTGHQRMTMYVTLASGVLSVASGVAVAGEFGMVGVACTTAFAQIVQNLTQLFLAKRYAGVWTHITTSPRAITEFLTGRSAIRKRRAR